MIEITIWIIIGIIGTIIAAMRGGRLFKWLIIGIICGPFAFIHVLMSGVRCPACNKWVNSDAIMCPSCHLKMQKGEGKTSAAKLIIELILFAAIIGLIYIFDYMGFINVVEPMRKILSL